MFETKYFKKSETAEKKSKKGPFGIHSTFANRKNLGLVRDSNPRSPASETLTPEIRVNY